MGQHLAHILCQKADELILYGRQMDLLTIAVHTARGIVDAQLAIDKDRCITSAALVIARLAQGHPDAGQKFINTERFGQIIIGPGIQRFDLVAIVTAGADHDDGRLCPTPQLADDFHAVCIRQPQIQ